MQRYSKKQKEGINILKNVPPPELAKIILSWMKSKYGEYSHFKMEDYWMQYDLNIAHLSDKLINLEWESQNIVFQYITNYKKEISKKMKEEKKRVELQEQKYIAVENIPKIIVWVKEEGWSRLTKGNLNLYLSNNYISLKPVVRQELYNQVNKKLKNL